jgi:hypothetical protein
VAQPARKRRMTPPMRGERKLERANDFFISRVLYLKP